MPDGLSAIAEIFTPVSGNVVLAESQQSCLLVDNFSHALCVWAMSDDDESHWPLSLDDLLDFIFRDDQGKKVLCWRVNGWCDKKQSTRAPFRESPEM